MAIARIRIDYTVYSPNYQPKEGLCLDFNTFTKAKAAARRLGVGSRVYRNFNQTNKKGLPLGDWWNEDRYWLWNGSSFRRVIDKGNIRDRS